MAALLLAVVLNLVLFPVMSGWSAEAVVVDPGGALSAEATKLDINKLLDLKEDTFEYKREGRSDPFVPFVSDQAVVSSTGSTQAGAVAEEVLTGMRRCEPGQLTVVAIVSSQGEAYAMVENSLRMGFVLRKGDKVGRTGVVEDIVPNRVLIKQYSFNMAGEKRFHTVEMQLKKEGEK